MLCVGRKHSWRRRIPFLAALLLVFSALPHLFRPFWFDEVITLENFVLYPPLFRIYFLYEIPNNHIVFSMLEKLWIELLGIFGAAPLFLFRGLPLICGLLGIFLLAKRMVRSCGPVAGGILCAAFAASPMCGVFATGLRGYMPGFLLTVLAIATAEKIVRKASPASFTLFFLIAVLAVGTTPTDLAALEGAALFHAALLLKRKRRMGSILYLLTAPVLALILFYMPIRRKFFHCLQLGEGWFSAGSAAWDLYVSFALVLIGLLPFCIAGSIFLWKKYSRLRLTCAAGILLFLLPLPAFFVFKAPAFPRVFFPLFPLWLLLCGYALSAWLKKHRAFVPLTAQLICTALLLSLTPCIGDLLFGDARHDDLTLPYYARQDFEPHKIIVLLQERVNAGVRPRLFASFDSDHPSLLFLAACSGVPEEVLLADLPNRPKLLSSDFHGGECYLATADETDLERHMNRFGFRSSEALYIGPYQRLDRVFR
jgi:hypothetical protein